MTFRKSSTMVPESWREVFLAAGINYQEISELTQRARHNGTSVLEELASNGNANESRFYEALADTLNVRYRERIDANRLVIHDKDLLALLSQNNGPKLVLYSSSGAENRVLISPEFFELETMRDYIVRYPAIARRMEIVTPRTLRSALLRKAQSALARRAVSKLFEKYPQLSARIVANAVQGFGLGLSAGLILTGLWLYPTIVVSVLHCVFSIGFLSCVALRTSAAFKARPPTEVNSRQTDASNLPRYTVLVALYKEAEVVPNLLLSLSRLNWPASKLEVKLILEDDDADTLEVMREQELKPNVEILIVPNFGPRTKPKALSYAIPVISGEIVAVYDAEDEPHPDQLMEAWSKFEEGGDTLACVQAPLHIRNGNRNLLTKHYSFEYAALFRGLLPDLARRGLFFPLGGTSNHFRVSALLDVYDWDPFNVTEDADLAIRLARFGYHMDMIEAPTLEDAPDQLSIWIKQRTRWFKGWMQTFLVHSRSPIGALHDMKFRSYLVSQILLFGIIISSMSYIFIILIILSIYYKIINIGTISMFETSLLVIDTTNIVLGLSAFLILGWKTLTRQEKKGFWKIAITTPLYWLALSYASWRAALQLYHRPFLWEKTPHHNAEK